jgi:hypothetical protein
LLTGYRGPPQGYSKYLEQRLHFFESIICRVSSASPTIAKEFEDTLKSFSNEALNVSDDDLDAWRTTSPVASLLAKLSAASPNRNILPPKEVPNDSGVLEMDEHSVIRYLGPTSGLHLVSESSLLY